MAIVLPNGKQPPTRVNPRMALFYGLPKVGKTTILSQLDSCLIADFEGGAELVECARVSINSCKDIDDLCAAIIQKGQELKGEYPFTYIALDTIDKLEEYVETTCTTTYNASKEGRANPVKTVADLPYGAGYGMIRRGVIAYLDKLKSVCKYLIIIAHVKDKILDKGGVEVTSRDISLSGKLSGIVCSKVDVIGYLSRNPSVNGGKMMVNFQTFDNSVMGARCAHLIGQQFEFDWNKIYLEGKV